MAMKTLVIVESPSKAKTIEKYLGSDYTVRASVGHVRDLPKSNKDAVDIKAGFVPRYVRIVGKEKVLHELAKEADKAGEVLLATDPDREGEAIAYHVATELHLENPKRIMFQEITKTAILESIKNPRKIDGNLVKAQEARRVLDRLFGYDLSALIWSKVRFGLSAGRVQSPSLRIIMEREREIRAFVPEEFFRLSAELKTERGDVLCVFCAEEPRDKKEAERIQKAGERKKWIVANTEEKEQKRTPRPPFTTSTMQQTASTRLGFSPSRTMRSAQKLYEQGFISYMRTDSVNLSNDALSNMALAIKREFGDENLETRVYKTKSKVAQEAHEAVRPTDSTRAHAGHTQDEKELYELIRARALASQMKDAVIARSKIIVLPEGAKDIPDFSANGSRVIYKGWLLADPMAQGEEINLPKVAKGDALKLLSFNVEEKFTEPPPRYTEAGLIKELEKRGIGRPSTYAAIMRTLADRGYVIKEGKALKPTDTGDVVSTFLEKNFEQYISDTFTAEMENELDEIANGEREYSRTLTDFYTPFLEAVKSKKSIPKITMLEDVGDEFKCPICNGQMAFKLAKTGKFMTCKKFPECLGARKEDGNIIAPPKELGEPCPKCSKGKLVEREGRFGLFVACANYPKCKFVKKSEEEDSRSKTGVHCPDCKKGEIKERRGRFGLFYSCSEYPACKFAIKAKPTGNICKDCGALMMEGTKTIPERCSDKKCANHNPHKNRA